MSELRVAIENVRAEGGLIHDLPPFATQQLAENYELYTTTLQRDPGTLSDFYPVWRRTGYMRTIAQRVGTTLSRSGRFDETIENGTLDTRLTEAFSGIAGIECDDVHVDTSRPVPKNQKGIVTATTTRLYVPNVEHAQDVAVTLQGMLRTGSDDHFYPVYQGESPEIVIVEKLDEHAARSLSRQLEAVVAQGDKKHGVTLPPDKSTFEAWQRRGETFPPHIAQRLRRAAKAYGQLALQGTYRDRPDLQPRRWPRIIGTDAAAFMEGIRDILGGLIYDPQDGRGGSHHNLEQHPYVDARPLIERGINLKRPKVTPADITEGPAPSYPLSITQRGVASGQEWFETARRNPWRAVARGASRAASVPASVLDMTGAAIELLPTGVATARELAAARTEWERQKQLAAAGGKRLDKLAALLRRRELDLPVWDDEY